MIPQKNGREVLSSFILSCRTLDDSVFATPDILIAFMDPNMDAVTFTRVWIAWFQLCWSWPMFLATKLLWPNQPEI
jgi:hypothetical protein